MDLKTFYQEVLKIIAMGRAGSFMQAIMAILSLVAAVSESLTDEIIRTKAKRYSSVSYDAMGEDVLLDKLEKLCQEGLAEEGVETKEEEEGESDRPRRTGAAPKGPFIDAMLPILFALLKKFIGL